MEKRAGNPCPGKPRMIHDAKIEAVLFDMDGVLCKTSPYLMEAATRLFLDKYNVQITQNDFKAFAGSGETRYLSGIAGRYDVHLDMPADTETLYAMYLDAIKDRLTALPGVFDFIHHCRKRLMPIALATSAHEIKMHGNLREIGLPLSLFDAKVTGNDVAHPKPNPEIFELAARRLGLYPQDCLAVEDSLNGVAAAKAAGCYCLAVTTEFDQADLVAAGADWVATDLSEIHLSHVQPTS